MNLTSNSVGALVAIFTIEIMKSNRQLQLDNRETEMEIFEINFCV